MYIFLIELVSYSFYFQFFGLTYDTNSKLKMKNIDALLLYF